ncbi:MAG: peptidoglycan DD-metalloendopeptidase family protein [Flavobacteriales bacterium]|nr:peptidoglycan DD-metalloendopeptidase family protein [Flavobacteriales bacterium]
MWKGGPNSFFRLLFLVAGSLFQCLVRAHSTDSLRTDTVSALVMYGDNTLLEGGEALSDERLDAVLDSLCTMDDPPADLLRDLLLFRRIRAMEGSEIISLIDSLFELDTVPYALVNEINLYAAQMPTHGDVSGGRHLAWEQASLHPFDGEYGPWVTTNPVCYARTPAPEDSLLLVQLVDGPSNCGFTMPIEGVLTSRFGWRDGRPHNGIDIDLEVWDPVRSAFPGVVRFSGFYGNYGRLVVVRHYNGLETFYAHLHRLKVSAGDVVDAGDVIGLGGSSGRSTGSHLHFEVRYKGTPIDPSRLIDLSNGELLCEVLVLKGTRYSYAAYPKGTRFHTVRKGDHLYAIAESYGTTVKDLCALNGISRRSILRVGQQLLIADAASR